MGKWYDNYLRSEHWIDTRIRRLKLAKFNLQFGLIQCEHSECGLFVPPFVINIHHLTYERVGHEQMEDLQILCRSCHKVTHSLTPEMWWEQAKSRGAMSVMEQQIRSWRGLKRIGDVMEECLAYSDLRAPHQCSKAT